MKDKPMIVAKKFGKSGTVVASRGIIRAEYDAQENKGTRKLLQKIARRQAKLDALTASEHSDDEGTRQLSPAEKRARHRSNVSAKFRPTAQESVEVRLDRPEAHTFPAALGSPDSEVIGCDVQPCGEFAPDNGGKL